MLLKIKHMKVFTFLLLFGFIGNAVLAQVTLLPDQNPNYMVSQAKYVLAADSINKQQDKTLQNTYKAYDWYEAREERRASRIAFRRELRMERARNSGWNNGYGWNNQFNNPLWPLYQHALPLYLMYRWWR